MDYKSSDLLLEDNIEECIDEEDELIVSNFSDDELEITRVAKSQRKPGLRDVVIRRTIEDHLERKRRKESGEYFDLDELAELEGID